MYVVTATALLGRVGRGSDREGRRVDGVSHDADANRIDPLSAAETATSSKSRGRKHGDTVKQKTPLCDSTQNGVGRCIG